MWKEIKKRERRLALPLSENSARSQEFIHQPSALSRLTWGTLISDISLLAQEKRVLCPFCVTATRMGTKARVRQSQDKGFCDIHTLVLHQSQPGTFL